MAPRGTWSTNSKSTSAKPGQEKASTEAITPRSLQRTENEQKRIFILPRDATAEARIITLPNPATLSHCRYLFCPTAGLFEFTRTSAPNALPSSWLIAQRRVEEGEYQDAEVQQKSDLGDSPLSEGYVLEDASLFIATPIDPVFFLATSCLPVSRGDKSLFRMEDDHMDALSESSIHMKRILRNGKFKTLLVARLQAICLTQYLGGEEVFKPDLGRMTELILGKARRMSQQDNWPASMENALVKKQLDVPVAIVAHFNPQLPTPEQSQATLLSEDASDEVQTEIKVDEPVAAVAAPSQFVPQKVIEPMRLRVAFNFILSSYIPAELRESLRHELEHSQLVDFNPLDQHLERVKAAKAEVHALRSLSDNVSRKRPLDDDEAAEAKVEKKRKKEDEENRKKAESRAIKQLKKVDTTGMQKMSAFFKQGSPKKKGS